MKNKKKIRKILAIVILILFMSTAIISSIMAMNTMHLESCHEKHCCLCTLIHTAIYITNNLTYLIAYIILIHIIFPSYFVLIDKIISQNRITLVELKVRLNE